MSNIQTQTQSQVFRDLCWVVIEIPKPEDLIKALKWILTKERMEKDLDLDASVKITYFTLTQCGDTQCYKTFDRISIANVRNVEIAKFSKKVDERRWEHVIIAIPKKFADAQIVLKHESELSTHYHVIYTSSIIDATNVNGWKERIIFENDS